MRSLRLVLKPDVSDEDVSRLAGREDWMLTNVNPGDDESSFEKVWQAGEDGTTVHYLVNATTGVPYLTTRGQRRACRT